MNNQINKILIPSKIHFIQTTIIIIIIKMKITNKIYNNNNKCQILIYNNRKLIQIHFIKSNLVSIIMLHIVELEAQKINQFKLNAKLINKLK